MGLNLKLRLNVSAQVAIWAISCLLWLKMEFYGLILVSWHLTMPGTMPSKGISLSSAARDRCLQSLNWEFMGAPFRPIVWTLGSVDPKNEAKRISFFGSKRSGTALRSLRGVKPRRFCWGILPASDLPVQIWVHGRVMSGREKAMPLRSEVTEWMVKIIIFPYVFHVCFHFCFHIFPRSSLWCLSRICSNCTLMLVCSIGAMRPGLCRSKERHDHGVA